MALDRDLNVAVLRACGAARWDGWEMTAATGVRGLRLLRESGALRSLWLTEANPRSFPVLSTNVQGEPRATADRADAAQLPRSAPFDYVDLDPYGSPLPLLDRAVEATRDGGWLAVSATDLPVLAGAQAKACRRLYGAEPARGRLGPEGAVRLLVATVLRAVAGRGRSAHPRLAYVGGHHVRAYVELAPGPPEAGPIGTIAEGDEHGPPLGRASVGPLWLGPLVDRDLASRLAVFPTAERGRELARLLKDLRGDAEVDRPFYYEANALASRLHLPLPPPRDALIAELRARGHRAAPTHVRPEGVRTDAERTEVDAVARALAERAQSQNARVRA